MRRLAAVAAVAALVVTVPTLARAQPVSAPSGPDTYLQLHGGAFLPQRSDLDGFHAGYDLGLVFGARFERHVSAEMGIGYSRTGLDESLPGRRTESTLSVLPITVSLRLRQAFKFAELSALAGVGLHVARLSSETTIVTAVPETYSTSATSTPFGFHVGAGAAFNLWPTMLVGVEAVQTFAQARFDGVATRIDGLRVAATLTYRL